MAKICDKCGLDHDNPKDSSEGLVIIACAVPKFKLEPSEPDRFGTTYLKVVNRK